MLKPLGKKSVIKKEDKPAQVIVSVVNGQTIYSNADTGAPVNMNHNRFTPAYEIFNVEKASIVLSSIAQGRILIDALEDASISKATFSTWLMANDEFSQALDKARSTRAQFAHEKFHSIASEELLSELPDEDEDIKLHMRKLNIIAQRQKILGIQKKEDNPTRFSDKEMNQLQSASVAISIDPDIINKMQTRFTTSLTPDGELDLGTSNKQLSDILDADFKEVK